MTENDKELIKQALATDYRDWREVSDLMKKAETIEGWKSLNEIRIRLYHYEERKARLL